jgi:hypothetical protein
VGAEPGNNLRGAMTKSKGTRVVREGQTLNFTSFERFFAYKSWGMWKKFPS